MTESTRYRRRDERAAHLAGERPHAAEILSLYRQVLTRQEPLHAWARTGDRPAGSSLAALRWGELDPPFRRFIADLVAVTPGALSAAGRSLAEAENGSRQELLRRAVAVGELGEVASSLGLELPHLVFWARSFLQPLAEALAETGEPAPAGEAADPRGTCPSCGWPPQVAFVRDEPEHKGRRYLVCALCATEWPFPRVRCPSCGEAGSDALLLHEPEGLRHVRVEECTSCHAYWKSVDLRENGHAVPVVEDLASPELDLWAEERDLWKVCRNLAGL